MWIFALSAEDGHTRLISRNRIAAPGAWPARLLGMLVMEPGSLIMDRKMLLGIKERAEGPGPRAGGIGGQRAYRMLGRDDGRWPGAGHASASRATRRAGGRCDCDTGTTQLI